MKVFVVTELYYEPGLSPIEESLTVQVCGVYKTEEEADAKVKSIKRNMVFGYYSEIMVSGLTREMVSDMNDTELDSAVESCLFESFYRKSWDVQEIDFTL